MQLIESKTLGSAQASIEFTNIPQTFTDLYLVTSVRSAGASSTDNVRIQINGATSGHNSRVLYGTGSGVGSTSDSNTSNFPFIYSGGTNFTSNTFNNASAYFPNYSGSTTKSMSSDSVMENNGTEAFQSIQAGLFNSTDAISSIKIYFAAANIAQYSSASLYGITKGSDGTTTVS